MSLAAEQWEAQGFNKGVVQGRAEGEARGKAEGEAKGKAEGEAKGKAEMLLRLLRRRCGLLPEAIEVRVCAAESGQLDDWSERFVDAQTIGDVFGTPH